MKKVKIEMVGEVPDDELSINVLYMMINLLQKPSLELDNVMVKDTENESEKEIKEAKIKIYKEQSKTCSQFLKSIQINFFN